MNIWFLPSTRTTCSVCTSTDWDSCNHNSQRTSQLNPQGQEKGVGDGAWLSKLNRLHILRVTGYIHVRTICKSMRPQTIRCHTRNRYPAPWSLSYHVPSFSITLPVARCVPPAIPQRTLAPL